MHGWMYIYLDLAKVFDKVPHRRLLEKVKSHGISDELLLWIENWLSHRKERVQLQVTSDVPQESVLGPLVSLIYTNDLEEEISATTKVLKFEDGSKVFGIVDTVQKATTTLFRKTWMR